MSKSSFMKKRGGNVITKNMMKERMDSMAVLTTAMEAALMEWEVWYRLIKVQKKALTPEQFEFFLSDGPVFTDIPGKIMESVRGQMPKPEELDLDKPDKLPILDSTGLPAQKEAPKILDSHGMPNA